MSYVEDLKHDRKAFRATRDEIHDALSRWRNGIIGIDELVERVSKITKDPAHELNVAEAFERHLTPDADD